MDTHAVASASAGTYQGDAGGKFKQPSEKIKALAAISLTSKVGYLALRDIVGPDDLQVYSLLNSLPVKSFRGGERVYPRDKQEPLLCYVKRGTIAIYRSSPEGKRRLVKQIGEGILFGEMRMLGQTMLGSEAEAKDWAEIVFLTAADSEELIANSRGLAWRLVRQLGPRLVDAEKRHERTAFQTVTARVALLLLEMADSDQVVNGLAQKDIADLLGVYRETVTVALSDLKRANLIEVGRRRIRLLNVDTLRSLDRL